MGKKSMNAIVSTGKLVADNEKYFMTGLKVLFCASASVCAGAALLYVVYKL